MAFGTSFSTAYYTGLPTTSDTRWDVAIGGHGYMIDTDLIELFGRQTVPMIREQSDTGDKPAESSLNPAGLWRRAVESWHFGAGQDWYDRPDSNPYRFRTSKGVDVWTKYALGLLPDTTVADSSTDTNLYLAASGGRLYFSEGQTVRVTGVGDETFATATGTPAAAVTALASDGSTCYAGFGASGIYTASETVFASYATGTVDLVRYAHGRLLAANGNALYNVTASGAIPAALYTHPNASWDWTDATEGPGHIYLSGFAGDKSMIYRTAVKADGTALDVPVVAVKLPEGEIARSVTGYLGYVVIGTDNGVRFAVPDANGNLTLGALIPTGSAVYCAEGQDRFVWYGLTNYDSTSTGLGRLDLTSFTSDLTPAYATDLMATAQGTVQAVATYRDKRWFTVSGAGLYKQSTSEVASGTITTGRITYGLPDYKLAVALDVRHDPLPSAAAADLSVSVDDGAAEPVGTSETDGTSVSPPDAFVLNQVRGAHFEITATLEGDITLRRVTLRADPAAERTVVFTAPLLFRETLEMPGGVDQSFDLDAEFQYLTDLCANRTLTTYQEGGVAHPAVLDDYQWRPHKRTSLGPWDGTFVVKMKEV